MSSMNEYTSFMSCQSSFVVPPVEDDEADFAAFLNFGTDDAQPQAHASPPLFPLPASPAPAFENAFSPHGSASPASNGTISPFDIELGYPFGSATTAGLTTPDKEGEDPDVDFPSLFYPFATTTTTATSVAMTQPTWSPQDVPLDMSPAFPAPPAPVAVTVAAMADGRPAEKHTGTRNTRIPAIPLDAPTMSRTYLLPAVTSRKRAPAAITSKLAPGAGKRATKRARSVALEVGEEGLDPSDLPEELVAAIEDKRRSNTLAARVSRMRKANHLKEVETKVVELTAEVEDWKRKCAALEEAVRALRGV